MIELPMPDAINAVETMIAIEGLANTSDVDFAKMAETIANRIAAFAEGGGLKKLNREYQALKSPVKAASREANQAHHARLQDIYASLPESERTKLKAEFAVAKAADGKLGWGKFLASAFPELKQEVAVLPRPGEVADVPSYESWLLARIGPAIAAMAGENRLPAR
ncbi:hypothetical protein [Bradyrhizobium sp. BR 10261]|uniref:hypothetical protein n=1 Tax=Bradyrhizobium sp. BR 10261 TaxID=2749992 RepID=UPI001C64B54B|nr:hypothetical protein [Bradyrhizobium sp. BR 10261]MBW7964954.1 hypothetical protein [Bradyrhizobium sp. BR 10261]